MTHNAIEREIEQDPHRVSSQNRVALIGRNGLWDVCLWLVLGIAGACSHQAANGPSTPTAKQSAAVTDSNKIDLDLKDVNLLDAVAMLAGNASINIFADSDLNEAGRVSIDVHAAPWEDVLAKIASDHQLRVEKLDVRGSGHSSFWLSRQSSAPAPVTIFTGERITARFDETPIRDVAKTLGDFAKTNIVVDDNVQANITLHLRLPWDLALYHLAQKYELRIVRSDGELRISRQSRHDE